jgi:hypothetical protein
LGGVGGLLTAAGAVPPDPEGLVAEAVFVAPAAEAPEVVVLAGVFDAVPGRGRKGSRARPPR